MRYALIICLVLSAATAPSAEPTEAELTTMKFKPEDIGPGVDPRNAEVTVYHMWDESMVGVASIDREAGAMTFSSPTGHPPGAFGVKKYVVWNTRDGLTQPGQWCLDRTAGKVLYRPVTGEDMTAAQAFAPAVESIITLAGTAPVEVRRILINSNEYDVAFTTATEWSAEKGLTNGPNLLVIEGLDKYGRLLYTDSITITYTGSVVSAVGELVITEIMYHPLKPKAEFIEIHNRSSTESFDLTGWRLNGVGMRFDGGRAFITRSRSSSSRSSSCIFNSKR